jgi:hypothetical protein
VNAFKPKPPDHLVRAAITASATFFGASAYCLNSIV